MRRCSGSLLQEPENIHNRSNSTSRNLSRGLNQRYSQSFKRKVISALFVKAEIKNNWNNFKSGNDGKIRMHPFMQASKSLLSGIREIVHEVTLSEKKDLKPYPLYKFYIYIYDKKCEEWFFLARGIIGNLQYLPNLYNEILSKNLQNSLVHIFPICFIFCLFLSSFTETYLTCNTV